ncbi:hypothetical protein K438DRAFT_1811678 [Mycena galopus ATCC 62051]|nr:hypothetical protein K438DRAFT_1811678 [Mycena galopus ATCC 62051]
MMWLSSIFPLLDAWYRSFRGRFCLSFIRSLQSLPSAFSLFAADAGDEAVSAAQACNEDALRLIFEQCLDSTLASAGRVCRAWAGPAQKELFAAIPPRSLPCGTMNWEALGRVLISSPRLRSYVRKVQIFPYAVEDLARYEWIRLLPSSGLISLELLALPNDALHAALGNILLDSPEFSALQRLVISGFSLRDPAVLERCLLTPSLQHLGIMFLGPLIHRPGIVMHPSKTLSRLSIRTWVMSDDIVTLIHGSGVNLRRLDLALTHPPDSTAYMQLNVALRDAPHLEHVSFDWAEPCATPFLDGLAPILPNLRHLRAGAGLYTAAFFSSLPPGLETLHLQYDRTHGEGSRGGTDNQVYFPVEAAIVGLSTYTTIRLFTLSPEKSCPFIEFPALVAAAASGSFPFRLSTPERVLAGSPTFWD